MKRHSEETKRKIAESMLENRKRCEELRKTAKALLVRYYGERAVEELERLWPLLYFLFSARPSRRTAEKLEELVDLLEEFLEMEE